MPIFKNDLIHVKIHVSEVPWLIVFTNDVKKEFSHCSVQEKGMIFLALDIIEKKMLSYYQPEKINLASFGNMLPHVHWHISARFKEDSYFPEPMWGSVQREGKLDLPSFEKFCNEVASELETSL
ncbi:MAG: HIT family protein [Campylobacterota bacterium]|nr:HIT family protein [Campylobacterota bacterium]